MPYDSDSEDDEQLLHWDPATNREAILFCIDCSPKMHEINPDSVDSGDEHKKPSTYFYMALKAVVQMEINKLIESPEDSVGIMLFNSQVSDCPLTGKGSKKKPAKVSNAHPHSYLIQPLDQVSVPAIAEIKLQLAAAEDDPDHLKENYAPYEPSKPERGFRIYDYLTDAKSLLIGSGKGRKRCFWITNDDRPFRGANADDSINKTGLIMKQCRSDSVMIEPFFISTKNKTFDTSAFYADAFAIWGTDENSKTGGVADDEDISTSPLWAAETKFADFDQSVAARKRPKRTLFKICVQLADGMKLSVKGYTVAARSKKELPLKTSCMEVPITSDDEDLDEDGGGGATGDEEAMGSGTKFKTVSCQLQTKAQFFCTDTGQPLEKDELLPAFRLGQSNGARGLVEMDTEELRKIRTMDMEPGLKIIGFRNRDLIKFEEVVSNAYFIYPHEEHIPGSTRAFAALHHVLLKRKKVGVGILMTRQNTSPYFVGILPQAEKRKTQDAKKDEYVPPGLILIPLPYADDIRNKPENAPTLTSIASDELVEMMRALLVRNAQNFPFNPDLYPNPSLGYHNKVLMALAFGDPLPESYDNTACDPDYERIARFAKRIKNFNECLNNDPDVVAALEPLRQLKEAHQNGVLAKYTVDQLKKICGEVLHLSKTGKKAELIERIVEALEAS